MAEQSRGVPKKTSTVGSAVHEAGSRNAARPLPEVPQGQPSSRAVGRDGTDNDLVYNLVRRNVQDYPSLERNPPPYCQVEDPGVPQARSAVTHGPTASSSPTPQASSSAAASSPADPAAMQSACDGAKPPCRPLTQQPGLPHPQPADGADDIMELQANALHAPTTENQDSEANEEALEERPIPNTNFAIACMVALCFNLPLGVLAIFYSLKALQAFQQGHTKLGMKRSRWSIFASLLGIAITTVIVSSIILYIAMQGQGRIRRNKAFGVKTGLNI